MAEQAQTTPGPKSALKIAAEKARAELDAARIKAEAAEKAAAEGDPDEEAEETPAEEAAEELEDGEGKDKPTAEETAEAQAQSISKSAEGKANPAAALAAIEAGLTLEQFQAMAKTAGTGKSRLAVELAGAPRLGADAANGGKTAAARGAAATFARNLEAGRKPVAGR